MPRFLKSGQFWFGFVAGAIVGPMLMAKVAPGVKAKMPQG